MPKEDYLIKYLEKLNRVIAAMMGFRESGFPEDALRLAQEVYTEMLAVNLEQLYGMTDEEFNLLLDKYKLSHLHIDSLAEILYQSASAYDHLENKERALNFFNKSLLALLKLNSIDKTFSFEREERIRVLKDICV